MFSVRMTTLATICLLALASCAPGSSTDIATDAEWQQVRLERGQAALADCIATRCERLDLDGNRLDDYTVLNGLTHIKALMVSGTGFADLGAIAGMAQLEELHISRTPIADLSGLARFPGLRVLHVQLLTEIDDYSPVTRLRHLEELAIGTGTFDDFRIVAALPHLKRLLAVPFYAADLSPLRRHPGLEVVDLSDSTLTDVGVLLTLPRLREAGLPPSSPGEPLFEQAERLRARGVTVTVQPVVVVC